MKSIRPVTFALVLGAMVIALAGCGKSNDAIAPTGLDLDTTPPAAPTDVVGSYDPAAQRDYLSWTGSTSPDVAGYEVWQYESDPALGGTGVLISALDESVSTIALPITSEARPAWFRLRAMDDSGNLSAYTPSTQHDLHAWEGTSSPSGGPIRDGDAK